MQQLTAAQAREKYHYKEITGELFSKGKNGQLRPVGFKRSDGIVVVTVGKNKKMHAHRLAYLIKTGSIPDKLTHVNGDKSDNRFENISEYAGDIKSKRQSNKASNASKQKIRRICAGDIKAHAMSERWLTLSSIICDEGFSWFIFYDIEKDQGTGWRQYKVIRQNASAGRSTYWLYYNKEKDYWCHTKDKKALKQDKPGVLYESVIETIIKH